MDYSKNTKKYWRTQIKARGVQALGGKCAICGGVFDDCCYDFHHLNPTTKDFNISDQNTNGARSWLYIRDELKKCALLCANCHRRYHNALVDFDTEKSYFNEDFYDWDLCNVNAVDTKTGLPLDNPQRLICPTCGGPKSARALQCVKCSGIHTTHFEVTREELKELIYTLPFTAIGVRFGVTDNAIRKRCIALGLPSKKVDIKKYSKEEWDKI